MFVDTRGDAGGGARCMPLHRGVPHEASRTAMSTDTDTKTPPTAAVHPFTGAEYLESLRGPRDI
jgi:hypothetical protein